MNTSLFGYFRHQFAASPLRRFLWIVPLIAVLSLGTFFVDSALASALHPVLLTVLVLVALQEEETVYSAYGVPRSRAVKLTAFAVVPSVVFGAAVSLAARPDWVGVAGAVGALVAGLVTGSRYIDGEVPDPIRVRRSQFGERGYTFELIFKPQLLWAFGVALAHSGMLHLVSHIGGETLRDYLGALPLLAWYAVYCMADSPIVGPGVGAAYGVPRKRWMLQYLAGAAASVGLYAAVVAALSPATSAGVAVAAVGGLACAAVGPLLKVRGSELGLFPSMLMFFPVMNATHAPDLLNPEVAVAVAASGILLLVGVAFLAAYLGGIMNPKRILNDV